MGNRHSRVAAVGPDLALSPPPTASKSKKPGSATLDATASRTTTATRSPPPPPTRSLCPYHHGTVDASPYPGYVQGKHPEICPRKCVPRVNPSAGETPLQTLLREAYEYCDLYHAEMKRGPAAAALRWVEIEAAIRATGTYDLTFDELQHGLRVAWRNAPKCSNRSKWAELTVADLRGAKTNAEMGQGLLELMEASVTSGGTAARMAVFRPRGPGERQGPRIWNGSLLRFAGYVGAGGAATGGILGDPCDAGLTTALIERYGWVPPSPRTRWDVIPLLLQCDETRPPELFHLPPSYVPIVPLRHPEMPELDALDLKWFGVPVVSDLEMTVGGLFFSCTPFVGWFADTEILRDLTDVGRINVLPDVAKALRIDTSDDLLLDRALLAVNRLITHSFREAGFAIVTHHTIMKEFTAWYRKELHTRGYCTGNWKWIIPPTAASTTEAYLGLSKMTEYTLRPLILPHRFEQWRAYDDKLPAAVQPQGTANPHSAAGTASTAALPVKVRARRALRNLVKGVGLTVGGTMNAMKRSRPSLLIAYASVSGTAAGGAARLHAILGAAFVVTHLNLGDFVAAAHARLFADSACVIFVTSTYGSGAAPPDADHFLEWAASDAAVLSLTGIPVAVLGYGSSAYPRFAAAADTFARVATTAGAVLLMPPARVDALGGSEVAFTGFVRDFSHCVSGCAANYLAAGASPRGDAVPAAGADAAAAPAEAALLKRITSLTKASSFHSKPAAAAEEGLQAFSARLNRQLSDVEGLANVELNLQARRPPCDYVRLEGIVTGRLATGWGNTHKVRVAAVEELLAPAKRDPQRSVVRVSFDLSDVPGGLAYAAGDNIAVYPRQSDAAVARAAAAFGWGSRLDEAFLFVASADTAPAPFPTPTTLRTALAVFLSLEARPGLQDLEQISRFTSGDDAALLAGLCADKSGEKAHAWLAGCDWVRLLERLPSARAGLPGPGELLALLPPQHPRYYSASSAPRMHPGALDLTVGAHSFTLSDGKRGEGVCSSYLHRLRAGDTAELRVIRVPTFRLPVSSFAPVIAIASGTGIAPLRAFWQERVLAARDTAALRVGGAVQAAAAAATPAVGPFHLLFGTRTRDEQLYAVEVAAAVKSGAVTAAHIALSREPGVPKTYVQHLLAAGTPAAAAVTTALAHPKAAVFVCGDANMAAAVDAALRELLGELPWGAVKAAGRYHEDVFGLIKEGPGAAAAGNGHVA